MALIDEVSEDIKKICGPGDYNAKARRAQMDPGYLWLVLNGKRNLTLKTVEKIAAAVGYRVQVKFLRQKKAE